MSYLHAPFKMSGRMTSTSKALIVLQSQFRKSGQILARKTFTSSSSSRIYSRSNRTRTYLLALSTTVSLGTFWYTELPGSIWINWMQDKQIDATASEGLGLRVQPSLFNVAKHPLPVMMLQPTSTQPSSSLPASSQMRDLQMEIYEGIEKDSLDVSKLPREAAILTKAPDVPPPITRDYPVLLQVPLRTTTKTAQLTSQFKYELWTFNDMVPGPFIRARVGDVVELSVTNMDQSGNPHNIDSHAFTGPGGGSAVTTTELNETKTARFKLLNPGIYLYHCAAAPIPVHIANGMYGLMYVQPAEGDLPAVDQEYYVMQSEFYYEPPEILEDGRKSSTVEFSYPNGAREEPDVVVFNGSESAMTRDRPLKANVGETVRIFFGNAGPNLTSSFHVIGSNFKKAYRDGDVISPPGRYIQTVSVPAGAATIVDMKMSVPGTYAFVDHAIFRMDKGAVGYLNVSGKPRPDIYYSTETPSPCVGCKLHP